MIAILEKAILDRGTGLLGDFELGPPPSLFLDDGSSSSNPAAGANIVTFKLDEIAPSELAVDRKFCRPRCRHARPKALWNKGRLIGQKWPLKP